MSKCEICGKDGFHKLSCTNNNARVSVPMSYIPTLEGDEAEEFICKAEQNVKDMRQRIIDKAIELQERYDNDFLKMQELISKESNFVTEKDIKRMRRCKNHVWRKDFLNGGKKCQVCGKAKESPIRNKEVEE